MYQPSLDEFIALAGQGNLIPVYREILAGRGHGIEDARPGIELVYAVNHADVVAGRQVHPLLATVKSYAFSQRRAA